MSDTDPNGIPGQQVGMRLNRVPTDPGGAGGSQGAFLQGPYLASSPEAKRKAAKSIEEHIEPDTRTAGKMADESTGAVVKAFGAKDSDGWLTSGALKSAHETWGDQVKALMNRLGAEKPALLATNTLFGGTDKQVGSGVRQIPSSLDGY